MTYYDIIDLLKHKITTYNNRMTQITIKLYMAIQNKNISIKENNEQGPNVKY